MPRPSLTPIAISLPETVPFIGPEALERTSGTPFLARLGANESPFGMAPQALAALATAAPDAWKYGDPQCYDLRQALARRLGVHHNEIVIGEGIDGLLGLAVRLFVAPGQAVVTSLGGYPTLNYHVTGFGGRVTAVPYRDDHEDLDALAEAVAREQAALVYLANPDNPMGSWWPANAVERFIAAVPATCMILLDEAYGEFAPSGTMPPIDPSRPNVLRLRTFSKAYGMAGLRCGYAIGDQQAIAAFERVRNHFGVNALAQAAALAALGDDHHLATVIARTQAAKLRIADIARGCGLVPLPSATNFVTIDCRRDGAHAQAILRELALRGVFIRKPMAPGLDRCIRIGVGEAAALDILVVALPEAVRADQ